MGRKSQSGSSKQGRWERYQWMHTTLSRFQCLKQWPFPGGGLSMQPYIGILCMHSQSDGLSTIPDVPNTLTHQSSDTNDSPRYLLLRPVTWNPSLIQSNLRYSYDTYTVLRRHNNCKNSAAASIARPLFRQV